MSSWSDNWTNLKGEKEEKTVEKIRILHRFVIWSRVNTKTCTQLNIGIFFMFWLIRSLNIHSQSRNFSFDRLFLEFALSSLNQCVSGWVQD